MKDLNKNSEVFLKILGLEITKDRMMRLVYLAFIAGLLIGAYAASNQ